MPNISVRIVIAPWISQSIPLDLAERYPVKHKKSGRPAALLLSFIVEMSSCVQTEISKRNALFDNADLADQRQLFGFACETID